MQEERGPRKTSSSRIKTRKEGNQPTVTSLATEFGKLKQNELRPTKKQCTQTNQSFVGNFKSKQLKNCLDDGQLPSKLAGLNALSQLNSQLVGLGSLNQLGQLGQLNQLNHLNSLNCLNSLSPTAGLDDSFSASNKSSTKRQIDPSNGANQLNSILDHVFDPFKSDFHQNLNSSGNLPSTRLANAKFNYLSGDQTVLGQRTNLIRGNEPANDSTNGPANVAASISDSRYLRSSRLSHPSFDA